MSPFPTEMVDRWQRRAEPGPGQGTIYWHVLFGKYAQVRALAEDIQGRLARFNGLHMTPREWLHMTVLVAGSTDEIGPDDMRSMLAKAVGLLSKTPPVPITFGRVLYHPEAIMLKVDPDSAVAPIREAAQIATRAVTGRDGVTGNPTPHVTVCYSTARQPATPIVEALGKELPECEATINALSLVVQRGAERLWDWHPVGSANLSG